MQSHNDGGQARGGRLLISGFDAVIRHLCNNVAMDCAGSTGTGAAFEMIVAAKPFNCFSKVLEHHDVFLTGEKGKKKRY